MRLDVKHSFGALSKRLAQISDDLQDKALMRTLNKVADGAAGNAASNISAEFMVTKGEARKNIQVSPASANPGRSYLTASVYVPIRKRGRGLNVIRFIKGQRIKGGKGRRQLSIQIKRSGGKQTIKGAFIGNDGRTVFIREGKGRTPIKAVATIDFAQMFNAEGRGSKSANVKGKTIAYILSRLPVVLQQEIKNVLRK